MPPIAVPSVITEPQRYQRRHYVQADFVYDDNMNVTKKTLADTGRNQHVSSSRDEPTGPSTYRNDFKQSDSGPRALAYGPVAESYYYRSLRDGNYPNAALKQRVAQADRLAHLSSYQEACQDRMELPKIQSAKDRTGKSLYQSSYVTYGEEDTAKLSDGANPWGKTKLLYVPGTKATVRDLLHVTPPQHYTSYKSDYQQWPAFENDAGPLPAAPLSSLDACRTVVPKAFKYRRWGGWNGL
ncbi:uncharacterized protein EV422DRAFT_536476 [Fimicolochytrium jonesii]|uniref:uncharacterized protein n=1 Tax=Fimicolochytrium jonesii TaxID=1396493 RepID=UPI0022FE140B|nr:uncharacterized protein EV422DRAFT_536476 [Fimicolochytrium jonesii]KAI8818672.1 hypothetical protein EV422DRAFT_536476 [Fimicolochytrium jonesii]